MARELADGELRVTIARDGPTLHPDAVRALEEEVARRGLRVHPWHDQSYLPILTTPSLDGFLVARVLGVVGAEYVLGISIFREIVASVSDLVGGRSGVVQSEMRRAREACLAELSAEANRLKADVVLATTLQLSEFSGQGKSMILMQATGTAVQLVPAAARGEPVR